MFHVTTIGIKVLRERRDGEGKRRGAASLVGEGGNSSFRSAEQLL